MSAMASAQLTFLSLTWLITRDRMFAGVLWKTVAMFLYVIHSTKNIKTNADARNKSQQRQYVVHL